jgi:phosphoribosylanthranilate isomerase
MSALIKICGMNNAEMIKTAISNKVDYLGFVFYEKSPRNLTVDEAKVLTNLVPTNIKKVAVLVDPDDNFLEQIKKLFDFFQLHGSETNQRIKAVKSKFNNKIIKAVKIKTKEDLEQINKFKDADDLLIDTPAMERSETFDFNLLKGVDISSYFLAGGINIKNVDQALKHSRKLDLSSGLEIKPGMKDAKKIIEFMNKVKNNA